MSQINVVPYIDVMLVLLVIFMVTAPLLQTGVEVDLPEVEAKPLDEQQSQDQEPLVVTVDRQGQFFLGSSNALSRENLLAEIGQRLKARADAQAYVRGDQGVEYGRVVEAMVILQQAGAGKIGLITDPPPEEPAR
ncbi:MAG: protein TolR [Chromatiales bacterium]|jgi:biopolymer transport protein TolR